MCSCGGTQIKLGLSVIEKITSGMKNCLKGNDDTFSANQGVKPDILVGVNYYWELIDLNLDKTFEGFYVVTNNLEKAMTRMTERDDMTRNTNVVACYVSDTVESYRNVGSIGITNSSSIKDDHDASEQFHRSSKFKDHRYMVSWPYKNFAKQVSDNFLLCYPRSEGALPN